MQPWQIKALELEASGLKHLDGFVHEHALYFLIGAIYLLLALLAWVLSGALRPKGGQPITHVRPVFFIHLPGPPPPPRTRSTRLRRRTIRRIAITIMIIGNDHWRCRVRGEILKSDSHGANGRGHRWRRGAHDRDGGHAPYNGSARHSADFRNDDHGNCFHWLRIRTL
jgi:hypothetical protein